MCLILHKICTYELLNRQYFAKVIIMSGFQTTPKLALSAEMPQTIYIYNQATSNLAIYSHETSQDKLSEA